MRVRISYSVGLEEVPEEVIRLLEKANENVNDIRDLLENMVDMLGNNLVNGDWAKEEIATKIIKEKLWLILKEEEVIIWVSLETLMIMLT